MATTWGRGFCREDASTVPEPLTVRLATLVRIIEDQEMHAERASERGDDQAMRYHLGRVSVRRGELARLTGTKFVGGVA